MSRFLSSKYEDLEPYTPGEQPKNMKKLIKLNTNENPYDPAPEVLLAINNEEIEKLRLYSDPEAAPLIEAAAGFYGVGRDMVMAGNGSWHFSRNREGSISRRSATASIRYTAACSEQKL